MFRFFKIAIPVFVIGFVAGNAFWYLFSPLWIDGEGRAQIMVSEAGTALVRLTEFSVTNGPDLEVWLVRAGDPQSSSDVKASEWVSLGALKGSKGDQTYVVPEGTDVSQYGSVVIWCEQFGVLFSPAPLSDV